MSDLHFVIFPFAFLFGRTLFIFCKSEYLNLIYHEKKVDEQRANM